MTGSLLLCINLFIVYAFWKEDLATGKRGVSQPFRVEMEVALPLRPRSPSRVFGLNLFCHLERAFIQMNQKYLWG